MSEKNIIIRLETKDDYRAVENLTRESFWNVYQPGCMEHYVLHCYRDDPAFVPDLDFVMELGGEMIGQIIYVRSEIDCDDGRKVPIMTFGPIGVAPAYKRQGYGKQLLDYSMEKAKEMGAGALAITGNIDFYGKSGFVPAKTKGVCYADDPDADYFLIRELTPGFLDGVSGTYKDPEGYFVCEKDPDGFERFEADTRIHGVPGTGSPIELTFENPGGGLTGKLFPTGNKQDILDVPGYGKLPVTLIDCANPVVIFKAEDAGLNGTETCIGACSVFIMLQKYLLLCWEGVRECFRSTPHQAQ